MRLAQEVRRLLEEAERPVKLYIGRLKPGETPRALTCREFLTDLREDRIAGVVSIDVFQHKSWTEQLAARQLPLVGAGAGEHGHLLDLDREHLVRSGVAALAEAGRRRLALIGWDSNNTAASRTAFGALFREALAEHGLEAEEEWIRTDIHPALAGAGWDQLRELWTARRNRPDGLLVCDDLLFRDAATAILDLDISVPDELMVVSHANQGSGIFYPFPVDKFEVDPDLTASRLVELLLNALAADDGPGASRGFYPMQMVPALPASGTRKQQEL